MGWKEPAIGLHVRHGDKLKEANRIAIQDYLHVVVPLAQVQHFLFLCSGGNMLSCAIGECRVSTLLSTLSSTLDGITAPLQLVNPRRFRSSGPPLYLYQPTAPTRSTSWRQTRLQA